MSRRFHSRNAWSVVPRSNQARGAWLQRQCACGAHTAGDECTDCKRNRVQRFASSPHEVDAVPQSVSETLQGAGRPLDARARNFMESRFDHDFSGVRVHTGGIAAASAEAIHARAYTAGSSIVFGQGQYSPGTPSGDQLLAHELIHVVQNGGHGGRPSSFGSLVSDPQDSSEHEARETAQAVMDGRPSAIDALPQAPVQRDALADVGIAAGIGAGLAGIGLGIAALAGAFKSKKKKPEEKSVESEEAKPKAEDTRPKLTFDEALEEGAKVLKPGFGVACGTGRGPDEGDGYDAREWKEDPDRGLVIVATTSSYIAFEHMVKNLGNDVPSSTGGKTKWHFDCWEGVELLRLYAYWRTMTPADFDKKFTPLEIGFSANIAKPGREWQQAFKSDGPKQKPYVDGEMAPVQRGGGTVFEIAKLPVKKTMDQLLEEAPKGSQVIFTNKDAAQKCGKDSTLDFCAFVNENTTKLGADRYKGYPFEDVMTADQIKKKMAEAVMGTATKQYIDKNIYISAIRYPVQQAETVQA